MSLLIWAAAAAGSGAAVPLAAGIDEDVVVTSVSPEPRAPSGILATAIKITGSVDGEAKDYFIFFHRPGQPTPAVGATCRIAFAPFDFQLFFVGRPSSTQGGRAVQSFHCGGPR
jgi:hypothetical protein